MILSQFKVAKLIIVAAAACIYSSNFAFTQTSLTHSTLGKENSSLATAIFDGPRALSRALDIEPTKQSQRVDQWGFGGDRTYQDVWDFAWPTPDDGPYNQLTEISATYRISEVRVLKDFNATYITTSQLDKSATKMLELLGISPSKISKSSFVQESATEEISSPDIMGLSFWLSPKGLWGGERSDSEIHTLVDKSFAEPLRSQVHEFVKQAGGYATASKLLNEEPSNIPSSLSKESCQLVRAHWILTNLFLPKESFPLTLGLRKSTFRARYNNRNLVFTEYLYTDGKGSALLVDHQPNTEVWRLMSAGKTPKRKIEIRID